MNIIHCYSGCFVGKNKVGNKVFLYCESGYKPYFNLIFFNKTT